MDCLLFFLLLCLFLPSASSRCLSFTPSVRLSLLVLPVNARASVPGRDFSALTSSLLSLPVYLYTSLISHLSIPIPSFVVVIIDFYVFPSQIHRVPSSHVLVSVVLPQPQYPGHPKPWTLGLPLMDTEQQLIVASLWAFEDVALKEIQDKFKVAHPDLECIFDYSKEDHIIKVDGAHDEGAAGFVSLVSQFIEEQKNKDLLDVPRIHELEITTVLNDEGDPVEVTLERRAGRKLVVTDSDSDEGRNGKLTKHWISSDGTLGCFARGNREIFKAIAAVTGTSIAINEDLRSVRVSGMDLGDVDDALAKLTRIEGPLSVPRNARTCNILIVPHDSNMRLRIDNYSNLDDVALDRVLADIPSNTNIPISEMFRTVSLPLDPADQKYKISENLADPPSAGEPGKSRIWNDFTFQEIGKGEEYINLESIIEKNMGVAAPGVSLPHPYLSAEKAMQVNEWVADGAEMEQSEPDIDLSVRSQQDTDSTSKDDSSATSRSVLQEERPRVSAINKRRGVKSRKPVPGAGGQSDIPGDAATSAGPPRPPFPDPDEDAETPIRKMWKMVHESESAEVATSQEDAKLAKPTSQIPGVGPQPTANPHKPEGKPRHASEFDATKYGLMNTPASRAALKNSPLVQKLAEYQRANPRATYGKRNPLVDVFAPASNSQANTQPLLAFDQPALVPQKPAGNPQSSNLPPPQKSHSQAGNMALNDLLGLDFGSNKTMSEPKGDPDLEPKSSSGGDQALNEQRLMALKMSLENDKQPSTAGVGLADKRSQGNKTQLRDSVADLERPQKPEERQPAEESTTRQFYRTMQQKAPNPGGNPSTRAEKKAKRQATLEDAWGIPKPGAAMPVGDHSVQANPASQENPQSQEPDSTEKETASAASKDGVVDLQAQNHTNQAIRTIFERLKPSLDAAEYFHGILSLEAQIGLILVPLLPKTYGGGMITLADWDELFRSRKGLAAPTTKFINRVTTTGSDVDHIVDLKNSRADSKTRLFEQEYSEYSVFYEYHCRTKADSKFVIVIDEQGRYSIKHPTAELGAVNLHFPKQIWDSRIVLSGASEHVAGSDPELEEAARFLVDNLWVQPDQTSIRIFTKLSEAKVFVIEKAFMKRWTRHRHVRPGDSTSKSPAAAASSVPGNQHSTASSGQAEALSDKNNEVDGSSAESQRGPVCSSKGEAPSAEESATTQSDSNEGQDIFLQITEVQDLFIGICPSYSQAVRARSAGPSEMIRTGRQWYEVSLISPAIEAILKSNSNVEIGEQTEEWRSSDLMGRDVSLLSPPSSPTMSPASPVAAAIGAAGLGELFRLSQKVVEKIDGIGYWNGTDDAEAVEAETLAPNPTETVPGKPPSPDKDDKVEPKSLDFEDIESVKDVGSVVPASSCPPPPAPPPTAMSASASVSVLPEPRHQFW